MLKGGDHIIPRIITVLKTFHFILLCFFCERALSQADCITAYGAVYGTEDGNELGHTLAATPGNDGFYVGGIKDDSVLIVRMDLMGAVLWSRTMDIVAGETDNISCLIVDSDGDLVFGGIAGTQGLGGTLFVCKYDPTANQVLWSKEFVTTWTRNYLYDVIEKGNGGNYVVVTNPHNDPASNNDAQLLELNRSNGNIVSGGTNAFSFGSSEQLAELLLHNGFLYGVGRYTDGASVAEMRHTLAKINPSTYASVWTRMGHRPANQTARLYGQDLLIEADEIYSSYHGDPTGTSTTNSKVFIQKTDDNGVLQWLKQYELPGNIDITVDMISSDGGIVMFAQKRSVPRELFLFKTDFTGAVLWAKQYLFPTLTNLEINLFGQHQLIEVGGYLVFTGHGIAAGGSELVVVRTDLNGDVDLPCVETQNITVTATTIASPVFYAITPTTPAIAMNENEPVTKSVEATIESVEACVIKDTLNEFKEVMICEGESYMGYAVSGTYTDTFLTSSGCDSIRILMLQVEMCLDDCSYTVDHVLGNPLVDEQGLCLAGSAFSPTVYIAGTRGNNTLLVKMDYTGKAIWSREFDMVPGGVEVPGGLIEDAEGLLVVAGTGHNITLGGTLYAFRYDPDANAILWSQEYTVTPNEHCYGVTEKGPGGNYLLNNSVNRLDLNHNYAEVFEIDRTTGEPVLTFAKNYQIIGTETLFELAWYNGALYGVGRYKDGGINQKMRNTLTQLDPADGDQLWVKMGHLAADQDARLYGTDLVITDGSIFSMYSGDPVGVSTANTKLYIQRTNLNGDLIWLKQYELPGNNDNTIDLAATSDGLIVLGYEAVTDRYFFYKIDFNGNVVWAKTFSFNGILSRIDPVFANRQLIEAGNHLFFVGYGINGTGDKDLIIVITDREGTISNGCIESIPVDIEGNVVANVTWYDKQVIQFDVMPENTSHPVTPIELTLTSPLQCLEADTLYSQIAVTICHGDDIEGYTQSGMYVDTFQTAGGCDSVRELNLIVEIAHMQMDVQICSGLSFEQYIQTGIYLDTIYGLPGICDTLRELHLTVSPFIFTRVDQSICAGDIYAGYHAAGIYTDTLITLSGCDSIRELHLVTIDAVTSHIRATLCDVDAQYNLPPGEYVDTLTSAHGCDSIRTLQLDGATLFIPNVFSPNSDGINDVFTLTAHPAGELDIEYFAIFDRFGDMVYETTAWPVEWKGNDQQGEPFHPGVFAYILIYQCGMHQNTRQGDITLVR